MIGRFGRFALRGSRIINFGAVMEMPIDVATSTGEAFRFLTHDDPRG